MCSREVWWDNGTARVQTPFLAHAYCRTRTEGSHHIQEGQSAQTGHPQPDVAADHRLSGPPVGLEEEAGIAQADALIFATRNALEVVPGSPPPFL